MTTLLSFPVGQQGKDAADKPRSSARKFVLKQGDTFLVADALGDVGAGDDGLFHNDTRILSRLTLEIAGKTPWHLGTAVSHDNVFFTAHLTNSPLPPLGGPPTPEGVIHIERKRLLWNDRIHERLRFTNFGSAMVALPISIAFGADYRDMFEVRGQPRAARGRLLPPKVDEAHVLLQYTGLDGVHRATSVAFSEAPLRLMPDSAEFVIEIPEAGSTELYLEIGCGEEERPGRARFRAAAAAARSLARRVRLRSARVITQSRLFNAWIDRSQADLALLTTELPTGPYPYAGIPWFSTPFGRDAVITALQTLWLNPALARGVLAFLARSQAHETSSFRDSAPGKIMHETRKGEMTALQEVPFGEYYGGVDTTPLFVVLAGAYADRTGDIAFIEELWPALVSAIEWVEGAGDSDKDGFLDYARAASTGLANQGWKDSGDSVFHADGRFPEGPIALVEVQGYVFAALLAMADLAQRLGKTEASRHWRQKAERLRVAVEQRFWMEPEGFYGLALDGRGELCRVLASNAGHLLFTGLATPERAAKVTARLMSGRFNSGWGIRTLASGQARFNPMSYHNGSVWPHDSAICAAGMARYGARDQAVRLLDQMFEAAVQFDMRLPELFCGFPRSSGEPPIPYPVACLPQAWAAGSLFMLLQACLGLSIDGWRGEIRIDRPRLPSGVNRLSLRRLIVGQEQVDLTFERMGERVVAFADGTDQNGAAIRIRL
ncbi:amylo-alpha-1,6-glucosidase [Roseomonas sp. E05]|uniref:amylo-alpha-1,6-glucosidase n=1 Tax=Roseomonas sp. E05 TaxID=3046310 RepID=UPI0024BAF30B|nr:amylo-alpha-1,6-glucosidase [Roseomonas sp. E05]MDJ0390919.1 amylo-alpha-1,6-glucosidase [Roseomonas sp. E05]